MFPNFLRLCNIFGCESASYISVQIGIIIIIIIIIIINGTYK